MFKALVATLLIVTCSLANSELRYNPYTNQWLGNICANQVAWTFVPFQPVGSFCAIRLPNGQILQGIILNQ